MSTNHSGFGGCGGSGGFGGPGMGGLGGCGGPGGLGGLGTGLCSFMAVSLSAVFASGDEQPSSPSRCSSVASGKQGIPRPRKGHEYGIPLGVHHLTLGVLESATQQAVMSGEKLPRSPQALSRSTVFTHFCRWFGPPGMRSNDDEVDPMPPRRERVPGSHHQG